MSVAAGDPASRSRMLNAPSLPAARVNMPAAPVCPAVEFMYKVP